MKNPQPNYFICLGSNTQPKFNMQAAQELLRIRFEDIQFSNLQATEAIDCINKAPFLNQVACFYDPLPPAQLIPFFKEIEKQLGRMPPEKQQGVIKIDLDLLKHNQKRYNESLWERSYVQQGVSELE